MIVIVEQTPVDMSDVVVSRSPYLSTLVGTVLHKEMYGNGYVMCDVDYIGMCQYVEFMEKGNAYGDLEKLYKTCRFFCSDVPKYYRYTFGYYAILLREWWNLNFGTKEYRVNGPYSKDLKPSLGRNTPLDYIIQPDYYLHVNTVYKTNKTDSFDISTVPQLHNINVCDDYKNIDEIFNSIDNDESCILYSWIAGSVYVHINERYVYSSTTSICNFNPERCSNRYLEELICHMYDGYNTYHIPDLDVSKIYNEDLEQLERIKGRMDNTMNDHFNAINNKCIDNKPLLEKFLLMLRYKINNSNAKLPRKTSNLFNFEIALNNTLILMKPTN